MGYQDGKSRTNKKVAASTLIYLPLKDRLKRLYGNKRTAINMTWHATDQTPSG